MTASSSKKGLFYSKTILNRKYSTEPEDFPGTNGRTP